jgi:putative tricarboxylic transport membrane protein
MRQLWRGGEAQAELILAACVWALAAAVWTAASRLPPPIFDPLGSAAVPKLIAGILAVLSLAMLAQRLRGRADLGAVPDPGDPADKSAPLRPGIAALAFLVMAACPAAMAAGLLGFRETCFAFILALGGLLSQFSRRMLALLLPTAALLAVGLSRLFGGLLYIDLPATPWLPF